MQGVSRRKFVQVAGAAALSAAALACFGCSGSGKGVSSGTGSSSASSSGTVDAVRAAAIGDTVQFGTYQQVALDSAGADPIEWVVVATNGEHRMLVSRYALAARPFDDAGSDVTWEGCTLRTWLNGEFYEAAFTDAEKAAIQETALTTAGYRDDAAPTVETQDKVFLLSGEEAVTVFSDDDARMCQPTSAARNEGPDMWEGHCWWWLRNRVYGSYTNGSHASLINGTGDVYGEGIRSSATEGVRPALWV